MNISVGEFLAPFRKIAEVRDLCLPMDLLCLSVDSLICKASATLLASLLTCEGMIVRLGQRKAPKSSNSLNRCQLGEISVGRSPWRIQVMR
jgi:hypothetical protein